MKAEKKDGNKQQEVKEIIEGMGVGKQWNEKLHDVDLIVHSSLGTIKMMTKKMTPVQIQDLRNTLKSKFSNTHGCFEMDMEDGVIMIPHELMVQSIFQIGIDAHHDEPEKKTKKPSKQKATSHRDIKPPSPEVPTPESVG